MIEPVIRTRRSESTTALSMVETRSPRFMVQAAGRVRCVAQTYISDGDPRCPFCLMTIMFPPQVPHFRNPESR